MFKGRWKTLILFHLFDGRTRRFSDLLRDIPEVTEKVPAQQLRQLEREGVVVRTVYPTVPPMVEYSLTDWGKALCPAFDALLTWLAARPEHGSVA